jgi:hypothetical protein
MKAVMEPLVGFEPTTHCLQNSCSTTELKRLIICGINPIIQSVPANLPELSREMIWEELLTVKFQLFFALQKPARKSHV